MTANANPLPKNAPATVDACTAIWSEVMQGKWRLDAEDDGQFYYFNFEDPEVSQHGLLILTFAEGVEDLEAIETAIYRPYARHWELVWRRSAVR